MGFRFQYPAVFFCPEQLFSIQKIEIFFEQLVFEDRRIQTDTFSQQSIYI